MQNPGNNLRASEREPSLTVADVSGLSGKVQDSDLEEIFGKFGRISKAQVMRDPHTGDSRGFGFVTFEDNGDAEAAMSSLNATDLLGRVITVAKARRLVPGHAAALTDAADVRVLPRPVSITARRSATSEEATSVEGRRG